MATEIEEKRETKKINLRKNKTKTKLMTERKKEKEWEEKVKRTRSMHGGPGGTAWRTLTSSAARSFGQEKRAM